MKKLVFLLFVLLISNSAFLQSYPQINVKPIKPKGKAIIYYSVKQDFVFSDTEKEPLFTYFPNSKLIDWRNSIEKLDVSEVYNPKKEYYVESCIYVDGKKNGLFTISRLLYDNYGSLKVDEIVVSGNYVNDEYEGFISFKTFAGFHYYFHETLDSLGKKNSGLAYKNYEEGVKYYKTSQNVSLEFSNGKIKDQKMSYSEIVNTSAVFSFDPRLKFNPFYIFKNQQVQEELGVDKNYYPVYKKYLEQGVINRSYIKNAYHPCLMEYKTEKQKIGNKEVFLDETIKIYRSKNSLFDTSSLYAVLNVNKQGVYNGKSLTYWENGNVDEEVNFKNGYVDGLYLSHFEDGNIEKESYFENGFIKGVNVYSDGINFNTNIINTLCFNQVNSSYDEFEKFTTLKEGRAFSKLFYMPLFGLNAPYQTNTALIKEKGGVISEAKGYQLLYKLKFKSDDKCSYLVDEYTILNNGKPMVVWLIDNERHNFKNALWKDDSGKIVFSFKEYQEKQKENTEAINNTLVKCEFCSKEVKYGAAIITDGSCSCFDYKNGKREKITLMGWSEKRFCSNKCRSEYEVDSCRRNGKSSE